MTLAFRLKVLAFAAVVHATSQAVEASGQPFGTIYAAGGADPASGSIVVVATNGTVAPFASGSPFSAIAVDYLGVLYAAQGNTIRRFAEDGTSTEFASLAFFPESLSFSPSGILFAASPMAGGGIATIATDGAVTTFASGAFGAVTVSLTGEVFASESNVVKRFSQDGNSTVLATLGFFPSSLAVTSSGILYATGTMAGSELVKILVDGSVSTVSSQPASSIATGGFDTLFAGSASSIVTFNEAGSQSAYATLDFSPISLAVVVPEPSTYALLLMTGAGALWLARRRQSKSRGLESPEI